MVMPAGMFLPKLLKNTREELLRETDYILEAQHQVTHTFHILVNPLILQKERFRMLLADYKEFSVPRVIGDLSTKRVLTTTFVRGIPLDKLMKSDASQETRNWVLYICSLSFPD